MSTAKQRTFAYLTLWYKGQLKEIIDQFEPGQEGIAASGGFNIKKENIDDFAEYLKSLPDTNGYVKCDAAIFFANEERPGDLSGSIKEAYVKPATEAQPASGARRRLT